ncbi:MAG: O-antigen ligase family protein [Candidatus Paracaedibacteraceae bacterium]|nr:O-antigen ligase family protein [Candidatus Paracaedibacteraceae bacterium]
MLNRLENWSQKLNITLFFLWGMMALLAPRSVQLPLFIIAVTGCLTHRFKNVKRLTQPEWGLMGLFCVWALASTQWSFDATFAFKEFKKILLIFVASALLILYFQSLTKQQVHYHFKAFLIGLGITLSCVIIDRLCAYPIMDIIHKSPALTYSRFIAVACLGVWGGLLLIPAGRLRPFLGIALILALVAFFWAYDFDAGPIGALLATLIMCLTFIMPKFTSYLLRVGVVAGPLLVVLGGGLFMNTTHWHKIAGPDTGNTHQQRLEMIDWASKQIIERPLGYGLAQTRELTQTNSIVSYTVVEGQLNKVQLWENGIWHLHNGFLQIFLELGIIGFLLIAAVVWILLGRLYQLNLDRYQLGVMHGYVTVLLFMFSVSFGVWQTWWLSTIITLTVLFAFKVGYEKQVK